MLFEDVPSPTRIKSSAIYTLRLTTHLGREIVRDQCPQRAAALAFTTVLSLVPVTALFVLYFKMAGKLDGLSSSLQGWILRLFVADAAKDVTIYMDQFVANMHTKALGTIGVLGLMISTYLLFRNIERSLNDIWRIRKHRKFLARFQILASVLIIVPAFMFASIYVSGWLQKLKVLGNLEQVTDVVFVVPFLLTMLSLFVLFVLIPNTRVRWRAALVAALFSTVLFEIGKLGFNFYVVHILPANKIYGSLGLLPVFLLWVYFSWMIILIGVELTFTIQNLNSLKHEAMLEQGAVPLSVPVHEEWGLKIMKALVENFTKNGGVTFADQLAKTIPLLPSQIEDHLEILKREKLIVLVGAGGGYVLGKPIEQIKDTEIKNAFRKNLGLDPVSL